AHRAIEPFSPLLPVARACDDPFGSPAADARILANQVRGEGKEISVVRDAGLEPRRVDLSFCRLGDAAEIIASKHDRRVYYHLLPPQSKRFLPFQTSLMLRIPRRENAFGCLQLCLPKPACTWKYRCVRRIRAFTSCSRMKRKRHTNTLHK